MNAKDRKEKFEQNLDVQETSLLNFEGMEGWDVYNCSQPFFYKGKWYSYGRIERRKEWMRSWVRLFERTDQNRWSLVDDSMHYQLEDPYISFVHDQIVMGGTHVQVVEEDVLKSYFGYFYYGQDLEDLKYFTTGPENMKDIRLVELADRRIGVFSRPRNKKLIEQYGSESLIGFTIIDSLADLNAHVIENAEILPDLFGSLEWGGVNQAYLLDSGKIGVIGHLSYKEEDQSIYTVMSFVLEPETLVIANYKMIATSKSFAKAPEKRPHLKECCFPSGIIYHNEDYCTLYSGVGDTCEAVTKIEYPFKGYGKLINPQFIDLRETR
ncbi:DUF1861 family protein [Enterococcus olivae]